MSKVMCECGGEVCRGSLWIEEGAYLWVSFADKRNNKEEREVQILNSMDFNKLVELRDMLNETLKDRVGL